MLTREQADDLYRDTENQAFVGLIDFDYYRTMVHKLLNANVEKEYKCPKCGDRLEYDSVDNEYVCVRDNCLEDFPNTDWACYQDDWSK